MTTTDLKTKAVPQPFAGSLLVVPNNGKPNPGIVLLHGSEGGGFPAWKLNALRWASEGFATMAFCYYGANDGLTGPRQTLANIEIGDVIKALQWLKNSEFVQNKKIALDGTSRGGELALLTGSFIDDGILDAIAVHAPASSVWGPWNHDWTDSRCWLGEVPTFQEWLAPMEKFAWNPKCGPDPRNLPPHLRYAWKWKGAPLVESSPIAVEKIRCPVFLTQGMKDDIWPAEQAKDIEQILLKNKMPHTAHFYENEGHGLSIEASLDRQRKLLAFYQRHLEN